MKISACDGAGYFPMDRKKEEGELVKSAYKKRKQIERNLTQDPHPILF